MAYKFYDNQKNCALKIIDEFKKTPYVILMAQMQSGKTGTYMYACLMMLYKGLVDNIIIVCGVSDKNLRNQCDNDSRSAIYTFCCENGINVGEFMPKLKVLFSQDINKSGSIPDKSIIIWEESHYAQSKINKPFKWFAKNNIEQALSGDFENIVERDIKILSVSATPFSENIDNLNENVDKKSIVFLQPAAMYRGLGAFIDNNCVFETFKLDESNRGKLLKILSVFQSKPKYLMFRVTKSDTLQKVATELKFNIVEYNMDSNFELNEYLCNPPCRSVIVIVKGYCRLGQVVHKKNVGMVFESSQDSKADATFQALWGRMCGTPNPNDNFAESEMPLVYVTKDNIARAKKYVNSFLDGDAPIIDHSQNVNKKISTIKTKTTESEYKYPSIPIKLSNNELFKTSKDDDLTWMLNIACDHPFWNGNNPTQIQELKTHIKQNNIKVSKRVMKKIINNEDKISYQGRSDNMLTSFKNQNNDFQFFAPTEQKSNILIRMQIYDDYYFMWWTKNQSEEIMNITKKNSLPKTTGKEAFSIHDETNHEVHGNGGQTYHLPWETSTNPELMKSEIIKCIHRSKEQGFERSICSQYDNKSKTYKGILLANNVWNFVNKKSNKLEKIIKEVENECNIIIKFVKGPGRPGKNQEGNEKYAKICW